MNAISKVPKSVQNNNDEIKKDLRETMENRKQMLERDADKDFYLYFQLDAINFKMPENHKIILIENIKKRNYNAYEIYSPAGEKLEKFPTDKLKDVAEDVFCVYPNEPMIIKIFSEEGRISYYYKLKISENGDYTLEDICYTIGEADENQVSSEYTNMEVMQ